MTHKAPGTTHEAPETDSAPSTVPFATRHSPLVSVVMSVYNDAQRLPCAVDSILGQSLRDLELIVINDGSTDTSGDLLDQYALSDERVRVVHQENTGLTRALIRGCELARSHYIARQDADDWSHPQRLTEQVSLLESDQRIGFVSCWTEYVGPADEPLETVTRPADTLQATDGLLNERLGPPAHGSVMFRKSIYDRVGGYRLEFYYAQDSDLWMRMAEISRIAYVTEVGYRFRRHENSISGTVGHLQEQFGQLGQLCRQARRNNVSEQRYLDEAAELTRAIAESRERLDGEASASRVRSSQIATSYLIGMELFCSGDPRARTYFRSVVRRDPWHWKAWIRLAQAVVMTRSESTHR